MTEKIQTKAILSIHPFPTLLAQTFQLLEFASDADPAAVQVLAKSALVFAAMSLECAATSCIKYANIPERPFAKMDTLSVLDKFEMLQWFATRTPLDRKRHVVQKIGDHSAKLASSCPSGAPAIWANTRVCCRREI